MCHSIYHFTVMTRWHFRYSSSFSSNTSRITQIRDEHRYLLSAWRLTCHLWLIAHSQTRMELNELPAIPNKCSSSVRLLDLSQEDQSWNPLQHRICQLNATEYICGSFLSSCQTTMSQSYLSQMISIKMLPHIQRPHNYYHSGVAMVHMQHIYIDIYMKYKMHWKPF